jgi:hypothetical protein
MKKPNFFIIGAPKCGTTSLYAWLSEHPNIFMPSTKEPMFYCDDIGIKITNQMEYERLFKTVKDEHTAVGEASVWYLLSEKAVPKIEDTYTGVKYIVIVRNPVELAYSLHDQTFFSGHEPIRKFEVAWRLSPERRRNNQKLIDYQTRCLLGEQMERLYTIVPRERVIVLFLNDIERDPRHEYLKVLNFLRVPDDGRVEFSVRNKAKEARYPAIRKVTRLIGKGSSFIKRLLGIPVSRGTGILQMIDRIDIKQNICVRQRSPMSEELQRELINYFRPDIKKLGSLTGRDLSHWLELGCE